MNVRQHSIPLNTRLHHQDKVLICNFNKSKFDPIFRPDDHHIVEVSKDGRIVTIERGYDKRLFRCHPDEIKKVHQPEGSTQQSGDAQRTQHEILEDDEIEEYDCYDDISLEGTFPNDADNVISGQIGPPQERILRRSNR